MKIESEDEDDLLDDVPTPAPRGARSRRATAKKTYYEDDESEPELFEETAESEFEPDDDSDWE